MSIQAKALRVLSKYMDDSQLEAPLKSTTSRRFKQTTSNFTFSKTKDGQFSVVSTLSGNNHLMSFQVCQGR